MKSLGAEKFWQAYRALPPGIKEAARAAHRKFVQNPSHPSLQLERLRSDPRFWPVRVTRDYRAVFSGMGKLQRSGMFIARDCGGESSRNQPQRGDMFGFPKRCRDVAPLGLTMV